MFKLTSAVLAIMLAGSFSSWSADLELTDKEAVSLKEAPFFFYADTQVAYYYKFLGSEPGIQTQGSDGSYRTRGIPQNVLNISHADAWAYGTNYVSFDILRNGNQNPAGTTHVSSGYETFGYGTTSVWGIYRGTLSLNALTGTKSFVIPGIVKDISISYGFNLGAKNSVFGSTSREIVGGLNFLFDVPAGFMNASVQAYKEWNRNNFNVTPNRDVEFDTVPEFEVVYDFPLTFTTLPLSLAGFNTLILPKGRGVRDVTAFSSNPKTGLEFLSRTNLVLDLGKLLYEQPKKLSAFVGFQYWHNLYGTVETAKFKGTEEKAILMGVSMHIF